MIVNAKNRRVNERILAAELLKPETSYDMKKYLELLVSAGETLLEVFRYDSRKIRDEILYHVKQNSQ